MYKQALKNMYKAATALPDGSAPLTMGGMIAPEWLRVLQNNRNNSVSSDYPLDLNPGTGEYGTIIPTIHDGPLTGVFSPNSNTVASLGYKGLEGPKLPEEGQPLTMPSSDEEEADSTASAASTANAGNKDERNALLAALANKGNYGALAALSAAGLGGLGGAAFGGNANERILNAITGAAGGAGAVGGARGAMELLEGNVDPLLAAGLGGVTGGIGSGALARLLAKTLMK